MVTLLCLLVAVGVSLFAFVLEITFIDGKTTIYEVDGKKYTEDEYRKKYGNVEGDENEGDKECPGFWSNLIESSKSVDKDGWLRVALFGIGTFVVLHMSRVGLPKVSLIAWIIAMTMMVILIVWWLREGNLFAELKLASLLALSLCFVALSTVDIAKLVFANSRLFREVVLILPWVMLIVSHWMFIANVLLEAKKAEKTGTILRAVAWVVLIIAIIWALHILVPNFFELGLSQLETEASVSQTASSTEGTEENWFKKWFSGGLNCAPKEPVDATPADGDVVFVETGYVTLADGDVVYTYNRVGGYNPEYDPRVVMFNHQNEDGYENDGAYGLKIDGNTPVEQTTNWAKDFRNSPEQIVRLRVQMELETLNSIKRENARANELRRMTVEEYDRIANETAAEFYERLEGGSIKESKNWILENYMVDETDSHNDSAVHGRYNGDDESGEGADVLITFYDAKGENFVSSGQGLSNTKKDAGGGADVGIIAWVNMDEGGTWKWKSGAPSAKPTPSASPSASPTVSPSASPTVSPTAKPTPSPSASPKPTKDPSVGTSPDPGDDPGPGEPTSGEVGGGQSTAEEPGSSDTVAQDEYHEAMDELGQESGGDPSTPTTTPPPGGTTHDSSGGGNGNGGVDDSTLEHGSDISGPSGDTQPISGDPPVDEWGGPPD